MKSRKSAFTLIELLVVIAIIAILAAILFPVFDSAKKAAQQASCLSNTMQISKAWLSYTDDYNGVCPPMVSQDSKSTWAQILYRYCGRSFRIFGCPAEVGLVPKSPDDLYNNGRMSYGWNSTIFNYPWVNKVIVSDLDRPSKTVFLCDSSGANWISLPNGLTYRKTEYVLFGSGSKTIYSCQPPSDRHRGTVNCAFADGHARNIPQAELIGTVSNTGRKVAYLDKDYKLHWTNSAGIQIFPYFAVSADPSHLHF